MARYRELHEGDHGRTMMMMYTADEFLSPSGVFALLTRSLTLFSVLLATLNLCLLAILLNCGVKFGMLGITTTPLDVSSSLGVFSSLDVLSLVCIASLTSFLLYPFSSKTSPMFSSSSFKYCGSHSAFARSAYPFMTPLLVLSLWFDFFLIVIFV